MTELTPAETRLAAFGLEVWLHRLAGDGRGLTADDPRRVLARKLALDAPVFALDQCPALLRAAGPDVTARVRELAQQQLARLAQQPTALAPVTPEPPPGPLTAPEVAQLTGMTTEGVRTACRRGRLAAEKDETGEWRISRQAVDEWRSCAA